MCVCRERERERERKKVIFIQPFQGLTFNIGFLKPEAEI